ncbi:type II toxin-antitoxin system HicA family toxin [Bifidobacterium choerinum]|uniref:Toxin HicA n=1 Tax=Bifidobacterium choerinum TaxID=35760 RepID=A0A2D3D5P8_9BIFI|nr:type II toxin-antitoxin system HicA family toxin [Bifidobacterium choerinum]ATU20712.1 toxin HicA [Bifidobacterium choerinum]
MRFREVERILLQDGWQIKAQVGSHRQYVHPHKQGKVTVPNHRGDLPPAVVKAIWKQAGIQRRSTK